MSYPFVGEVSLVGFNFAPKGWSLAAGQILPISQNTALFSLLGTNYGGDGRSNFALPNLQGSVALGFGQGAGRGNAICDFAAERNARS
jgi:microcystin-dependent protein